MYCLLLMVLAMSGLAGATLTGSAMAGVGDLFDGASLTDDAMAGVGDLMKQGNNFINQGKDLLKGGKDICCEPATFQAVYKITTNDDDNIETLSIYKHLDKKLVDTGDFKILSIEVNHYMITEDDEGTVTCRQVKSHPFVQHECVLDIFIEDDSVETTMTLQPGLDTVDIVTYTMPFGSGSPKKTVTIAVTKLDSEEENDKCIIMKISDGDDYSRVATSYSLDSPDPGVFTLPDNCEQIPEVSDRKNWIF